MSLAIGLTNYWKLDESSGNAIDVVGGNTLTNTSTTYSTGIINNGAVFNGSSSKLISSSYVSGTSWTINFWIYKTDATSYQIPICQDIVTTNNRGWIFNFNNTGKIWIDAFNDSGTMYETSTTAVAYSATTWTMVTGTWNTSTNKMTIYKNGIFGADVAITGNAEQTSIPMSLGMQNSGTPGYWFAGSLDEVGFWSRALSAAEITSLYNSGVGLQFPNNFYDIRTNIFSKGRLGAY